jgi:primary-amine oxidase
VDERWRFASVELREPAKGELSDTAAREALVVCWNCEENTTFRAVVSLSGDRVLSWEPRPGEQAGFTADEHFESWGLHPARGTCAAHGRLHRR